jgi:molybdate transport system substrate-binding protein
MSCRVEDINVGTMTMTRRFDRAAVENTPLRRKKQSPDHDHFGMRLAEMTAPGRAEASPTQNEEFTVKFSKLLRLAAGIATWVLTSTSLPAAQTNVAVAANFTEAAREIAAAFKAKTGHEAVLSFGASGQFYTQITQDAPFQVFLSADDTRPKKLVDDGLAVPGSRFTYAIGKLVLWSKTPNLVKGEATLKAASFAKLAICNPVAAPYGAAAVETMKSLEIYDVLKPKLVEGATITQAYQFVETGNAEVGFVALSQLTGPETGSRWLVPQELYSPIRQDAVLLKSGASNEAAIAFIAFLRSPEARVIIEKYGYALDGQS